MDLSELTQAELYNQLIREILESLPPQMPALKEWLAGYQTYSDSDRGNLELVLANVHYRNLSNEEAEQLCLLLGNYAFTFRLDTIHDQVALALTEVLREQGQFNKS